MKVSYLDHFEASSLKNCMLNFAEDGNKRTKALLRGNFYFNVSWGTLVKGQVTIISLYWIHNYPSRFALIVN